MTDAALAALPQRIAGEPTRLGSGPDRSVVTPAPSVPVPPVLVGGNSDVAIRRAARYGDGWVPSVDPHALAFGAANLRRTRTRDPEHHRWRPCHAGQRRIGPICPRRVRLRPWRRPWHDARGGGTDVTPRRFGALQVARGPRRFVDATKRREGLSARFDRRSARPTRARRRGVTFRRPNPSPVQRRHPWPTTEESRTVSGEAPARGASKRNRATCHRRIVV